MPLGLKGCHADSSCALCCVNRNNQLAVKAQHWTSITQVFNIDILSLIPIRLVPSDVELPKFWPIEPNPCIVNVDSKP